MFKKLFNDLFVCRYGNTHSETSLCAQQSTKFREEARKIIKKSVNANENDILLFTGTGSTGAVHTLVDVFDFHIEFNKKNTVVMVSAFEHHSNILPWKEKGVEVNDQGKKFMNLIIIFLSRSFEFPQHNRVYLIN
jgi:selenocysteine lyase/cysteine desulfurase